MPHPIPVLHRQRQRRIVRNTSYPNLRLRRPHHGGLLAAVNDREAAIHTGCSTVHAVCGVRDDLSYAREASQGVYLRIDGHADAVGACGDCALEGEEGVVEGVAYVVWGKGGGGSGGDEEEKDGGEGEG